MMAAPSWHGSHMLMAPPVTRSIFAQHRACARGAHAGINARQRKQHLGHQHSALHLLCWRPSRLHCMPPFAALRHRHLLKRRRRRKLWRKSPATFCRGKHGAAERGGILAYRRRRLRMASRSTRITTTPHHSLSAAVSGIAAALIEGLAAASAAYRRHHAACLRHGGGDAQRRGERHRGDIKYRNRVNMRGGKAHRGGRRGGCTWRKRAGALHAQLGMPPAASALRQHRWRHKRAARHLLSWRRRLQEESGRQPPPGRQGGGGGSGRMNTPHCQTPLPRPSPVPSNCWFHLPVQWYSSLLPTTFPVSHPSQGWEWDSAAL